MKATLEFYLDLPDEEEKHKHAVHADDMYYVLWEFLHNWGRHREFGEKEDALFEEIKDYLFDELMARGVVMD